MLWLEYSRILDFLGHFPFSFLIPRYFISVYRVIYTVFVYFIWNIISLSYYSLIVSIRLFSLKFALMFIPVSLKFLGYATTYQPVLGVDGLPNHLAKLSFQ